MASVSMTSPGGLHCHSGRLRYANAEDLPSYPSSGLRAGDAAASAAASLGWANTHVTPTSPSHQADPWPQDALRAAGWAQRRQKQPPAPSSPWVSTAAGLAFRAGKPPPPTSERTNLFHQNSMHAAKGAMTASRPRAVSTPQTRTERSPERPAAITDALRAATLAHRPTVRASTISAGEAGAVPYTTMNRQMFTSNPPVKPETDEKHRADVLHASALAMAKKMYNQQQKMIDRSTRMHARSSSFPGPETANLSSLGHEEQRPLVYNSLQEAAYRLAQERLTKLQQEHEKQRGLQEYYGATSAPQRTRFGSIRGKLTRRRSSSDGDLLEDRRRSEQIRKQMSLLNNRLSEVDEEKRSRDRAALLATAQRNVKAQLHEMDAKVQSETGRVLRVNMDDWGRKALVAAQARFDAADHERVGKVDVGGGKFMDRSEVDKIAAKKVQPLLDEIDERAEKERARQEEERIEAERRREEAEREKMREREIQQIHKKLKDQQKEDERARKAEIKQEEKVRKDEARAAKAEQKQAAKEDKHKDKETTITPRPVTSDTATNQPATHDPERKRLSGLSMGHVRALSISFPRRPPRTPKGKDPAPTVDTQAPSSPDDNNPSSPTRKVRAWLLSRFPRPRSKSAGAAAGTDGATATGNGTDKKGFIGGVALARLQSKRRRQEQEKTRSPPDGDGDGDDDSGGPHDESMREVALAGRSGPPPDVPPQPPRPISGISQASVPMSVAESDRRSVSSLRSSTSGAISVRSSRSSEERFVEARSEPETSGSSNGGLLAVPVVGSLVAPPRKVGGALGGRVSPFRESRFSEILE